MTKMSADGKPAHSCTRILTDSARKRNRKAALVNCNKEIKREWMGFLL
jgi:hypothetical protein